MLSCCTLWMLNTYFIHIKCRFAHAQFQFHLCDIHIFPHKVKVQIKVCVARLLSIRIRRPEKTVAVYIPVQTLNPFKVYSLLLMFPHLLLYYFPPFPPSSPQLRQGPISSGTPQSHMLTHTNCGLLPVGGERLFLLRLHFGGEG